MGIKIVLGQYERVCECDEFCSALILKGVTFAYWYGSLAYLWVVLCYKLKGAINECLQCRGQKL